MPVHDGHARIELSAVAKREGAVVPSLVLSGEEGRNINFFVGQDSLNGYAIFLSVVRHALDLLQPQPQHSLLPSTVAVSNPQRSFLALEEERLLHCKTNCLLLLKLCAERSEAHF